ncbi:hemin uptake protein HemP [Mangrovibrevibacter kandeliae]|uniref:hemin uptake protein HemP n=1 Tax=Mangrovibrevibacter kandeliae TaxID=2968473 RepID=UPI002119871B|nr:hemin uptake protein HemP [Aurantimonas sp. MSK8Z-1]MCQ8781576.1 hemin uptake protein HemP [Aurantimonas sp. CSK15Z-1]MCW4114350.1 hemin uptake protein HemP [Aurantimonas sp. MSK8Z-1]
MGDDRPPPLQDRSTTATFVAARRVLIAEELFGSAQEVEIRLGETSYRLRLTRAGKLILTK